MTTTITTTIDVERYGTLLGPETWAKLADEYLNGNPGTQRAEIAARELGAYVRELTQPLTSSVVELVTLWHRGTSWLSTPGQPYDGLDDLTDHVRGGLAYVSTDHCDHPVWNLETNLAFRVWHDTAHVEHGLGFGVDDELLLFGHQARELERSADLHTQAHFLTSALFCESVYQLAAYVHLGAYPDVQHVVPLGPVGRAVRALLGAL